jgi:hypothetical protein
MQLKNKKELTTKDWVIGWVKTTVALIALVVAFLYLRPLIEGTKNPLIAIPMFVGLTVISITAFILSFVFIVRTFSLVAMIFFPDKKAYSVQFDKEGVTVNLEGGAFVKYVWGDIVTLTVSEDFYGVYIDDGKKAQNYSLPPIDYKILEKQIDDALAGTQFNLKKDKKWTESGREGLNASKTTEGVSNIQQRELRLLSDRGEEQIKHKLRGMSAINADGSVNEEWKKEYDKQYETYDQEAGSSAETIWYTRG